MRTQLGVDPEPGLLVPEHVVGAEARRRVVLFLGTGVVTRLLLSVSSVSLRGCWLDV